MKKIQHRKSLLTGICFSILLLLACNNTDPAHQEKPDSSTLNNHPHENPVLSDNEVKAEAPDANIKTEQGYALPRHTDNHAQSPINIISSKAAKDEKETYSFAFHSDINVAENLGHTIELEFKPGSTCTVNGKEYASKQFHFHTPSEHLVDGVTFPMEMHIVNTFNDSANGNKATNLVLAVLFKMGKENQFIKEFLDKVPNEEGGKHELQTGEVKLEDLLSQFVKNDIKSYYSYKGSLTTPPYSENVQWVVLKHVVEASQDQIMIIEKMEGNNARHVQALNDRIVYAH